MPPKNQKPTPKKARNFGTAKNARLNVADVPVRERDLAGRSGSAALVAVPTPRASVSALWKHLADTTLQYELGLLEVLFSPMTPYPLPGICTSGHFASNAGRVNGFDPLAPADMYPPVETDPAYGTGNDFGLPAGNVQLDTGGGAHVIPFMFTDVYNGARYDQREGLSRGTFSVIASGSYIIYFDPQCVDNPVVALALDTETNWCDPANTLPIFGPSSTSEAVFAWDRDPYRGYTGNYVPVGSLGMSADASSFEYTGGAFLHLAVQAKTAYSDVAIKARNLCDYDRRFFDAPTADGEYGDATQPEKANEAIAVYTGSSWHRPVSVDVTDEKTLRSRLSYIIQAGLPMLEVHVVNSTAGGAPVNFNFEARTWLGVSYNTLKDNATTSFHTVPVVIPPWFSACRTRGAVTLERSELSSALIENTIRATARFPMTPTTRAVVNAVSPSKAKGTGFFSKLFGGLASAVGIDPSNPLPSLGSLAVKKLAPLVMGALAL